MKRRLMLFLAALVLTLLGCGGQASTLGAHNMDFTLADADGIEVHVFRLGDIDLMNLVGRAVAAPLDVIIAVPPTAGPHPVAVIFHGALPVRSIRERVYAGFDYLVRQLAVVAIFS